MFSKQMKMILIVSFVLCFSLTFVSASQTNLSKINTNDESLQNSDFLLIDDNMEDDHILKTTHSISGGSFDDIQNLIDNANSGDTIILNGKFVAKDESSVISINKKLNITSSNGATLDGKSKTRIFKINSNAKGITINNIIFKDAYSEKNGGAIYLNASNTIITNCTFENCIAHSGGAISTSTTHQITNLEIKDTEFYSNHGVSAGGAILYAGKNLEITSSIFNNNYIELADNGWGGGALQIGVENQENNCKITDCIFNNNYVTYNSESKGHAGVGCLRRGVTFTNCNFTNNSAYSGGVLGFHDGGYVINCNFYNNYATESAGAISFDTSNQTAIVENSYFENNTSKHGGAISSNTKTTINNCIFKSNHANDGGVIYNNNILLIQDSYFNDNYAENNGGAIYNSGTLNSQNCQYQKNKATSTLKVNSKSTVKCSDNTDIKVIMEGGNNIINAIWSKNQVTIDDKSINPNNRISSQSISINIGGKIFTSKTNANGEAVFKINTKNFKVKSYKCTASLKDSDDYFESSQQFDLKIITKIVYKTKIKNIKKIKKVKKYQAYIPTTKYVKVPYKIEYYKAKGKYYIKFKEEKGFKKIKKLDYKWKKVSKKSIKTKYKWYKSKYCYVTKYKATKITYKYVNGKLAKKSVNKNYKYTKNSKYKNKRTKDWSKYVLPSTDCESDNKKIIKLSKKIIKNEAKRLKKPVSKLTDKQKANALLHWVQKKFTYDRYGNTRYGALKSLSKKKLNCVDSTHITIALLRATNIPAKYEAKQVKKDGHCWPWAYFGGKWVEGETTAHNSLTKFGKNSKLYKNWIKPKGKSGTHIDSYKYSKKFVQYGKNKKWTAFMEYHYINGIEHKHYVLNGNADTKFNKLNLNKVELVIEG